MERGHAALHDEANALRNRRKHGMRITNAAGLTLGALLATTSLLQAQTIPEYKSIAETWDRDAATLSAMFPHNPCGVVLSESDEFVNRQTVKSGINCDTATYWITTSPAGDTFQTMDPTLVKLASRNFPLQLTRPYFATARPRRSTRWLE
jgi:hypothetical protein